MTNKRGRRSTKKKHDVPLTEEMLNELNKNSLGGYGGHHGMGHHGSGMAERHHGGMVGGGYDNYGQDPDELYDLEDVWNNDRYNFGQHNSRYKVNIYYCFLKLCRLFTLFRRTIFRKD